MSNKKQLQKLEDYFENKDTRGVIKYRRMVKKGRNKWVRRSMLPHAHRIRMGWEY